MNEKAIVWDDKKSMPLENAQQTNRTYQEEQIFRLQIPVSDFLGMTVSHRFKQHETCITSFLFIVVGLLYHAIQKLASNHFFSDQIIELLFAVCFVKSNDVGVLEFRHDGDFYLQSVEICLIHRFDLHNLDCIRLFGAAMRALFNDGVSTRTELENVSRVAS